MEKENINHFYGRTLTSLVKGMKGRLADQKIKACIEALLEMGYTKKELKEHINSFFEGE